MTTSAFAPFLEQLQSEDFWQNPLGRFGSLFGGFLNTATGGSSSGGGEAPSSGGQQPPAQPQTPPGQPTTPIPPAQQSAQPQAFAPSPFLHGSTQLPGLPTPSFFDPYVANAYQMPPLPERNGGFSGSGWPSDWSDIVSLVGQHTGATEGSDDWYKVYHRLKRERNG